MTRSIIDYAERGEKLPLGLATLKTSEIHELAQIAFKGDVSKALLYAFYAGAYIGHKKGKESCRK